VLKGLVQLGWTIRVRHRKGRLLAEHPPRGASSAD
jgi:hypothetical protein